MKIIDQISIANSFQSSVNLDFDISNKQKLIEYVPTSDICEVLSLYFDSFINNKDQSSFLVGPYGKGKSFAILVMLQLACGLFDSKSVDFLIEKVSKISPDLAKKISLFISKGSYFIPVIINSDYDNLKQSFMVALRNSLSTYGFDDLVPQSSYDICREILKTWQTDPSIAQGRLSQCSKNYNLVDIDDGLKNYSPSAYGKFVDLYNCVTIGQRFNPLINENIPKLYEDVSAELIKRGRKGIIVVFDEFSKFLESKSKKLGEDLKFVQDFAEKATRSDNNYQLHFTCIAHKPISMYGEKSSKTSDLLKTVEGRFITLRFQRGMKENMELIANAINKKDSFGMWFLNVENSYKWLFDGFKQLRLLDKDDDVIEFSKGCYPLNPLCAYLLVRISELVAQNERTLFTFISGNDSNGLRKAVVNTKEDFIDASYVYDYFLEQFENSADQYIKDAAYLAESALSGISDTYEIKIIKIIALFKILNDPRTLISSRNSLCLALNQKPEFIYDKINSLISNGILRESETEGLIDFSFVGSKEINAKAESLLLKELRKIKPISYLNDIFASEYSLPREYNAINRIVRYGRFAYIDYETFINLDSYKGIGILPFDYLILRIVGENIDSNLVKEKIEKVKDRKVLVQLPESYNHTSLIKLLRYYAAYKHMIEKSPESSSLEAIKLILDECKNEIFNVIRCAFSGAVRFVYCKEFDEVDSVSVLNKVVQDLYNESPVINNEMLNRNVLTSQYRKNRNDVVDFIIQNGDDEKKWKTEFSDTSAQNTIWRIFVENIDNDACKIRKVISLIKDYLDGKKETVEVKKIVDNLTESPFGLRVGPLTLFFAVAISELNKFSDSSVSLYYRQKEIELDAQNLEKATLDVGGNYYFKICQGAKEKGKYLSLLIDLFDGKSQRLANGNAQLALNLFKLWYRNLPQIVRTGTVNEFPNCYNNIDETFLKSLSQFDLNPTDYLFETIPSIFGFNESLLKGVKDIAYEKERIDNMLDAILFKEFNEISNSLSVGRGSLLAGLKAFLSKFSYKTGDLFGNKTFIEFAEYVNNSNSFDNTTFIRETAPIITNSYIEDWPKGTKELYCQRLIDWQQFVSTSYKEENRQKYKHAAKIIEQAPKLENISPLVPLLEGRIKGVIDQFGQSLTNEDIAYALVKVLKDIGD